MQQTLSPRNDAPQWTELDQRAMQRALELAEHGIGLVSPGPLVGCVIVDKTGQIVGEGFYVYEKLKHAETYALEQAGTRAHGATAYVSLEPHAHHGRTPPCTDALISAGIARVVSPVEDPNPKVSGKGFEHLRQAGLAVDSGLLSADAEIQNEKYFHFMRTGRPFVHLKVATSLDGKVATRTGDSRWITGELARARTHELRHEYDAILIGAGTAAADDPLLTDRSGRSRRNPLIRVILDEHLNLSPNSQLVASAHEAPLVVIAGKAAESAKVDELSNRRVEVISDDANGRDLASVLQLLGGRSIQSLLVEGGARVAGAFLDSHLVNKVSFFVAPTIIGGVDAPTAVGGQGPSSLAAAMRLTNVQFIPRGEDIEITGYPAS